MTNQNKDSICPRCKAHGKPWTGDVPRCAFKSGVFSPDNWNCATVNDLRNILSEALWNNCGDQHACLLSGVEECCHVLLSWYKCRGKLSGAWMVTSEGDIKPLTLTEAERILAVHPTRKEASTEYAWRPS